MEFNISLFQLLQRVNNLESHVSLLEARDKLQQAEITKLQSHVQFQQKRTTWLEGIVRLLKQRFTKQDDLVPNGNTNDQIKNQNEETESVFHNSNSIRRGKERSRLKMHK